MMLQGMQQAAQAQQAGLAGMIPHSAAQQGYVLMQGGR